MNIEITDALASKTVKEVLFNHLGLSRGQVVSLKSNNGISVDGKAVTVRHILKEGEQLFLGLEDKEADVNTDIEPVYHPITVLYEDDDVICVDKPSGMATHPSHNHHGDTLANALAYYFSERRIPFVFRAVNRLDRETSGVVLVAKNRASASKLSAYMQKGMFEKRYSAILCGIPAEKKGSIDAYITRRQDSIIFRKAEKSGRESEKAYTEYEVVACGNNYSMVDVRPVTGRTHQIRVHFSYIGTPIYGDGLYGREAEQGLMLHARSLTFPLPGGDFITVEAPMPVRFEKFRRENEI